MDTALQQHIEALIFCADRPISAAEITRLMRDAHDSGITDAACNASLNTLKTKYEGDNYIFSIVEIADGYQFLTKPAFQVSISALLKDRNKKRLSNAALETLSIIAYKQPITRPALENIRGVNCDYVINRLLEKELVEIQGKANLPGKPVLYGTTKRFMEHLGLKSLADLPQPKDFALDTDNSYKDANGNLLDSNTEYSSASSVGTPSDV